jgi:arginase
MSPKQTVLKTLGFLGGAIHHGQLTRGVERGPSIIRGSGVFDLLSRNYGVSVKDYGDVAATEEEYNLPPIEFPIRNVHILGPLLGRLHQRAYEAHSSGQSDLLLTIGGDHSIGTATISAAHRRHKDLKLIWVDAHPDAIDYRLRNPNTPFSDNYHGMPLSHVTGMATFPYFPSWKWLTDYPYLDPKNVVLIAIRDIDTDEYVTL